MKLYAIVCAIAVVIMTALGCFAFAPYYGAPVWSALLYEAGAISSVLLIDLVVLQIVRLLPGKWFLPNRKLFKTEAPYSFLKIEKWQAAIPFTDSFKKCLQERRASAVLEGIIETARVESAHWIFSLLGFLTLLFFPANTRLWFSLPASLLNLVLGILPALVARYHRPLLEKRYRNLIQGERKKGENT